MVLGVLLTLPQLFWPAATTHLALPGWNLLIADTWFNGLQIAPCWTLMGSAVTWRASLIGVALGYGGPYVFERIYIRVRNLVVVRAFQGEALEAGMGMGDFKMLAWLGAFWGWQVMLGILALGSVLMLAVALPMLLLRRADGRTQFPFGCALALATPVVVFFGDPIWLAYMGLIH
jgi:prepilin signal peptidase PulO-like enzyme (type II secretory pathway)